MENRNINYGIWLGGSIFHMTEHDIRLNISICLIMTNYLDYLSDCTCLIFNLLNGRRQNTESSHHSEEGKGFQA